MKPAKNAKIFIFNAMQQKLYIEKLVQGGDCLARLPDGRACFVQNALPGELCEVKITQNKKDFAKGIAVKILEKSADRISPKCKYFGKCGGCTLQYLDESKEIFYLTQVEKENFKRIAHFDLPENFKICSSHSFAYRNRARVILKKQNGKVIYGFRKQESNDVCAFDSCPVLVNSLNEFLKNNAAKIFEKAKRKELDLNIFENGNGKVSYYYKGMSSEDFKANALCEVEICQKIIHSDASVFFQSNLALLPELVKFVKESICKTLDNSKENWLIDLFSGVGFFATILQDYFSKITTVERENGCLKHAKQNLKNAKNVENISSAAEEWLVKNVVDVPATLIVDPPRTGLPKEALEAIVKSSVTHMVYVSCDPVTLARDFVKLNQGGFKLKQAKGFAFYPRTPHLEMVFVLERTF